MSRKNHKMIDGRLLRTDKKMCHLKGRQIEKISAWLKSEFFKIADEKQRKPTKSEIDRITEKVYEKIAEKIQEMKNNDINVQEFERIKKKILAYLEMLI